LLIAAKAIILSKYLNFISFSDHLNYGLTGRPPPPLEAPPPELLLEPEL
jgi:hypothetical protein